jgi:hypothetical protein
MENFKLDHDINLFCVKADSFPAGIRPAQDKLMSISKSTGKPNHFGISYWYDEGILYMAAAEIAKSGGQIPASCETYTLKKGNYISIYVPDFAEDITRIEKAFKTLLDNPAIDENGCCAECYLPEGSDFSTAKDIRCMVRLADGN